MPHPEDRGYARHVGKLKEEGGKGKEKGRERKSLNEFIFYVFNVFYKILTNISTLYSSNETDTFL